VLRLVGVGLLHVRENRSLFGRMTVVETLELGAYASAGRPQFRDTLRDVFEACWPTGSARRRQPLSGGGQQMLAIGHGLMAPPRRSSSLDELPLGLAPIVVASIFATIAEIRRRGTRCCWWSRT
jgi:branched-chain amino acid transport system ATP-binding protein